MLDLRSAPGGGTTADVWLPVATEAARADEAETGAVIAAARRATIMLVDDEELVRVGTADMLSEIGYDVIQAASGAEALRLLRDGASPDLLITDYLMPGMNGVELIQAVRAIAPAVRVMLITGYSTIAEGPGASVPRLAKPFRHADLARFVAELLGAESSGTVLQFRSERSG
jgi:CheY-like chemotaxis protein